MGLLDKLSSLLKSRSASGQSPKTFGELHSEITMPEPDISLSAPTPLPVTEVLDIRVTEEFKVASKLVESKVPFVFVTGRAGTGKTTFIQWLKEQLNLNVAVVAPTGLAALTVKGQTIHSFFRLPPRFIDPTDKDQIPRRRDRAVYEHLDLLVIDEISMVRADLLDVIDQFLRINGPHKGRTFGGVPILAVGDLHQLPPVVEAGEVRDYIDDNYGTPFFFGAMSVKEINPEFIELTEVFRQSDQDFLEILNSIRTGEELPIAVKRLNAACYDGGIADPDWTVLVPTRAKAHTINTERLSQLPGEPREYLGYITEGFLGKPVTELTDDQLEKRLPAPYRLQLKPGARVVFTKNDPAKQWVNGTTGIVRGLNDESIDVQISPNGYQTVVSVTTTCWERHRFEYDEDEERLIAKVIGEYEQYPLAPAWAMTIHKSQGQTLDRVCVDLGDGAFASGMTYVALSRCRSMDGLKLGRSLRESDVMIDDKIRGIYRKLEKQDIGRLLRHMDD